MTIAANIFVKDDSISPAAILGVVVNIYDSSTFALVATATTDSAGRAAFVLPGAASPGVTYEVRLFKLGVIFQNPFRVQVIDPLGMGQTNNFDVSGTLLTLAPATDPRCCRCTGRFLDLQNRPMVNRLVRFSSRGEFQKPAVLDGNMIADSSLELRTDSNGFVVADLIRGGEYWVMFAGDEDETWEVNVPDRTSMNLVDLIHPQPVSLSYDATLAPGNAITVPHGPDNQVGVPVSLLFSDFHEETVNVAQFVTFTNDHDDIVQAEFSAGKIFLTGMQPGVAHITAALMPDLKPYRLPDYMLSAPTLVVTIT